MTSETFECEIDGKKAVCWMRDGDLYAKLEGEDVRVYRNIEIADLRFDWPKDIVKQEVTFRGISE